MAPTGTSTFARYGPADPTCTTAVTTSTATVSGAGTYQSAAFPTNTLGIYRWIASYSGDPNNSPIGGACGASGESVLVTLPSSGANVYVTGADPVHALPEITQYTVAVDGKLSAKNPPALATPAGNEPVAIVASAAGRRVYAGGSGNTNTVYRFDVVPDGTLSPMTPATVAAGTSPSAIVFSGNGKTAYIPNFSDNSVSQFTIAADGTLTAVGSAVATGAGPIAIAVSPDGTNADIVNFNDDTVSQYTIAADGTLSPKTPAFIAADQDLRSIAVAPPQGAPTTTILGVTPAFAAPVGTTETLTATVSPGAAGTVYFVDGTLSLGAPVPVSNGVATLSATLAPGIHALIAAFSPTDPTSFAGSLSPAISYPVNAKRPLCIRRCR
jgi:DNA-binding beta-propeller fold protein YncE